MAGVIPASAPPGFGAAYADRQNTARQLDQRMVDNDLNRRATIANNVINSAPAIASVAGSGAIDRLLNMYADSETPVFNNDYSQMMDRLRMASAMPKPSGGSGKTPKPKDGTWYQFTYDDGTTETKLLPYNEADSIPYHLQVQPGVKDVKAVPTPGGVETNPNTFQGGGGGGGGVPKPKSNGDGTWTLLDGRVVDENGIEVDG